MSTTTDEWPTFEGPASSDESPRAVRSPIDIGRPAAEDPMLLRGDRECLGVPLQQPTLVNDRWYVHGLLGLGGHAAVFCALDRHMRRQVALKVHLNTTPDQETFLLTEAEIAAKFQHPSIATILDIGVDSESGSSYIVQELLQGATLREHLDTGNLPPLHIRLMWLVDLAEAISYAHGRNVIHRDIKPENVFITTEGVLKLMDFGVALTPALQERARNEITPAYSPPEVLTITPRSTPASDVFNWGLVAFELLTGGHHACGVTPGMPKGAVLSRLQTVVIPTALREYNCEVSVDLERLVMQALRRKAIERPDSATLERRIKHMVFDENDATSGSILKRLSRQSKDTESEHSSSRGLPLWVHWRNLGRLGTPQERLAYLAHAAVPSLRIAGVVLLTVSFYTWSHALFERRSSDAPHSAASEASTMATLPAAGASARQKAGTTPTVSGFSSVTSLTLVRKPETSGKILARINGATYEVGEALVLELPPGVPQEITWRQVAPSYLEQEMQTIELREGQELTLVPPFEAPGKLHVATEHPEAPGCLEIVNEKRRYVFSPLGSTIPVRPGSYRGRFYATYSCGGNAGMEVPVEVAPGQFVRIIHHEAYLEVVEPRAVSGDTIAAAISR